MTGLRRHKQDLRQRMKKIRAQAHAENPDIGQALRDSFFQRITLPDRCVVASYSPFDSEIDTIPLTDALRDRGFTIVLPVMTGSGQPLVFRRYDRGDRLEVNATGIREPLSSAPQMQPDILFVPLLAFDRQLYRLGYGGGYYDRTLENLRGQKSIATLGVAFSAQEIPEVPKSPHDVRLDKIITENQAFAD
jgi:5-formyltetrahydrofolate cyclo-ligase